MLGPGAGGGVAGMIMMIVMMRGMRDGVRRGRGGRGMIIIEWLCGGAVYMVLR